MDWTCLVITVLIIMIVAKLMQKSMSTFLIATQNEVANLQTRLHDTDARCKEQQDTISSLKANLEASPQSQLEQIRFIVQNQTKDSVLQTQLESKMYSIQEQIIDKCSDLQVQLESQISTLQNKIDHDNSHLHVQLESKIDELKNKFEDNDSTLQQHMESISSDLQHRVKESNHDLHFHLESNISSLQSRIEDNKSDLHLELESNISSLQSRVAEASSVLKTELESKVLALQNMTKDAIDVLEDTNSKIQTKLDIKIANLHSELDSITSALQTQLTDIRSGYPLAFTSRGLSVDNYLNGSVLKFRDVLTNTGGAYQPETGVFICPISGLYQFTVSLYPEKNSTVLAAICVSGEKMVCTRSDETFQATSTSVVLQLKQGDDVCVQIDSCSDQCHIFNSAIFIGHLIHQM